MPMLLPDGRVYTPSSEIAKTDPRLHKELEEKSREQLLKQEPDLYKLYKDTNCLECTRPRQVKSSRYCNFHIKVIEKTVQAERRAFKTLSQGYAYTEPGWNEGLNAYVKDKYHWKKLVEKFGYSEGLQSIG